MLQTVDDREQAKLFEQARLLFQRHDFAAAKELFEQAASGPAVEVAHASQMHVRMCERRLQSQEVQLESAEDFYNYGVTLMNRGELSKAGVFLRKAVDADTSADHYQYTLALCAGLSGDIESAARFLRSAIELRWENKIAARNDPDFQRLAKHPALNRVLEMERSEPG
jgi:tetratricopeptide (TPR) repeat protein